MNKNIIINKKNYIILLIFIIIFILFYFINLNTIIEKFTNKFNNIPLNIYQTWYTKNLEPDMKKCTEILKNKNPEFQYYLYDDNDCRLFIKNNFNEDVLNSYDSLYPGAYKADLWRYCILYINGGIYLDIKFYNVGNFKLIELINNEYFVKDLDVSGGGIYNALLICKKGNKKLLNCINNIVQNVKNKFYGESSLEPTGPLLLKKEFTEDELSNIRLSISDNCPSKFCIKFDNIPILTMYDGYYENRKTNKPSYQDLWIDKKIYN